MGNSGKKEGGNDDPLRPAVDLEETLKEVPDPELLAWVKTLGRIHKEQKALSDGAYQELLLTNRQYAFARILGEKGVIVAVNNDDKEAELHVRVPKSGKTYESLLDKSAFQEDNGTLHIKLQPNESQILAF